MTTLTLTDWLPWLADAPLFLDEVQVRALYGSLFAAEDNSMPVGLKLPGPAVDMSSESEQVPGLALSSLLTLLFPSLNLSDESKAGIGSEVQIWPTSSPNRQLLHLALHYACNLPDRVFAVDDGNVGWPSADCIAASPRSLIVIDVKPGAALVPIAAESGGGRVDLILPQRADAPRYPSGADAREDLASQRSAYWSWIVQHFDAHQAMIAVEDAATAASTHFEWVDYRMALWQDRVPVGTAHLHLAGRGQYPTGTYAYNMIKRASKHGIRIVGLLKSEPDINVLAIFER